MKCSIGRGGRETGKSFDLRVWTGLVRGGVQLEDDQVFPPDQSDMETTKYPPDEPRLDARRETGVPLRCHGRVHPVQRLVEVERHLGDRHLERLRHRLGTMQLP